MAKIQNPQDQRGIALINQTIFDKEHDTRVAREEDIQKNLESISGYKYGENVSAGADINTRINAEVSRALSQESRIESELNTKIESEITRATTKENELTNLIEQEEQRASSEEMRIDAKLDAEVKRSEEEDESLVIAIKAESDRATSVENTIISNFNEVLSGVETYSNEDSTTKDNVNTYGFLITCPKSGYLTQVKSHCRTTTTGSPKGGDTYLKLWSENNEFIACSTNYHSHDVNAIHEYNFEPVLLEKDKKYKLSFVSVDLFESTSISDKTEVCLSTTGRNASTDPVFGGYTLDSNFNPQYFGSDTIQAICSLSIAGSLGVLTNQVNDNTESISTINDSLTTVNENIAAIGLDIDAINETINSTTEPTLEILVLDASAGHEVVDEITLDVYTTDESGVTTPVDTLPDIFISYQCTDGFIYTSNAVAYSPFINVVLSEGNNQVETGGNNISEGRPQHDATLKFSGLSGIKEDITRVIIFDAIVAGNASNGYNNCKHISRIFPIHFRVAPSTSEEN